MCLAIFIPEGKTVSTSHLLNGWENNDDGAGYCFINEEGEIVIKKFMDWDSFFAAYIEDRVLYTETSPFLVHFRITSRGTTTIDNCHPFRVNDDMAIIHNGTISAIRNAKDDTRSDTKIFAEDWLPLIGTDAFINPAIFGLIEEFIGYSKVVLLDRNHGVFIFNEGLGIWDKDDDCWYSNDTYKYRKIASYTSTEYDYWMRETKHGRADSKKVIMIEDKKPTLKDKDGIPELCSYCCDDYAVSRVNLDGTDICLCPDCEKIWHKQRGFDFIKEEEVIEDAIIELAPEYCEFCYKKHPDMGHYIDHGGVGICKEIRTLCPICVNVYFDKGELTPVMG